MHVHLDVNILNNGEHHFDHDSWICDDKKFVDQYFLHCRRLFHDSQKRVSPVVVVMIEHELHRL
jgi:hypothetical protein